MAVLAALTIAKDVGLPLGKQHVFLERPPGPGNPVLQVADDVVEVDQPALDQRAQRELHGRGVAAGPGDQPRGANVVAVELGQAVNRLFLQIDRDMGGAVPFFISRRVAEAEIGAQIDNLHRFRQVAHKRLAQPMGQRREDKVDRGKVDRLDRGQRGKGEVAQMRKDRSHLHPGLAVGGKGRDLHPRMGRDQADEFGAGIARSAQNRDFLAHALSPARSHGGSCRAAAPESTQICVSGPRCGARSQAMRRDLGRRATAPNPPRPASSRAAGAGSGTGAGALPGTLTV